MNRVDSHLVSPPTSRAFPACLACLAAKILLGGDYQVLKGPQSRWMNLARE